MRMGREDDERILEEFTGEQKKAFEEFLKYKDKLFEEVQKKNSQGMKLTIDSRDLNVDLFECYQSDWSSSGITYGGATYLQKKFKDKYEHKLKDTELIKLFEELCESYQEFVREADGNGIEMSTFKELLIKQKYKKTKNKKSPLQSGNNPHGCPQKLLRVEEKRKYMNDIKAAISRKNMLEGDTDVLTYMTMKGGDGLLNITLSVGTKDYDSEEFVEIDRLSNERYGYGCEVITGGVASGKTVLTCRIAEHLLEKWEERPKDLMIIFISAGSEDALEGAKGHGYLSMFLRKKLKKRGKLIVIVDGLDELIGKGRIPSFDRILESARYYNSPLIISCRKALFDKICQKEQDTIISKGTIQNVRREQVEDIANILRGLGTFSDQVIEEVLRSPYFVNVLKQKCSESVIKEKDKPPQYSWNDYELMKMLFGAMTKREEWRGELNEELKSVVQRVAWGLYEYNGKAVTVRACFPKKSKIDQYRLSLESSFGEELIDMEIDVDNFANSIIKGFKNKAIGNYFLAEEYRNRLSGDKKAFKSALSVKISNGEFENILKGAIIAIPEDKKRKLLSIIEKLKAENFFDDNAEELMRIQELSYVLTSA